MLTAEQIKEKYKNYTPVPIISIAKDLNLKIYKTSGLSNDQSGLIRKEDDGYIIYINENHSPVRGRFTIAHEVAHFLKHRDKLGGNYITSNKQYLGREDGSNLTENEKKREIEANEIAAEILMPEEKFKEIWEKSDSIEEVADQFDVSVSAATIRASRLFKEMII